MPSLGPPLWPAGHLPLKGGDWVSPRLSPISSVAGRAAASKLPISPLEWEMPDLPSVAAAQLLRRTGRAERGAY
ncbi:hypothetical protein DPM33_14740 [Mesorhizobium hawassense]|uniref:Lytic murein transglycosylase n=1 Tax=Mesorhizobium hawassense TaxID=1209954 RepID=A0A330HU20_9HYPH|nr:hypothetical protein DPM33_14740 [Mesorhizobium hawassense]